MTVTHRVQGAVHRADWSHIDLTYVTTCYFDQGSTATLDSLLRQYAGYSGDVLDRTQFVVVDDGSPVPVTVDPDLDLNLLLLRVDVDISWNLPGARNLGVVYARSDKVVMTDLVFALPEATLRELLRRRNPGRIMYKFPRVDAAGRPMTPRTHPNTFFCSRARFLRFYGYDEEFCGHYGFGGPMLWRWQRYNGTQFRKLPARFAAVSRTIDRDAAYHTLSRDLAPNTPVAERKRREMKAFGPHRGHSRQFLAFPWTVVLDRRRSTEPAPPRPNRLWAKFWWWRYLTGLG